MMYIFFNRTGKTGSIGTHKEHSAMIYVLTACTAVGTFVLFYTLFGWVELPVPVASVAPQASAEVLEANINELSGDELVSWFDLIEKSGVIDPAALPPIRELLQLPIDQYVDDLTVYKQQIRQIQKSSDASAGESLAGEITARIEKWLTEQSTAMEGIENCPNLGSLKEGIEQLEFSLLKHAAQIESAVLNTQSIKWPTSLRRVTALPAIHSYLSKRLTRCGTN